MSVIVKPRQLEGPDPHPQGLLRRGGRRRGKND